MKISFDLHGVLDDMPEVLKFVMSAIIEKRGEVHIITGSTFLKAKEELNTLGFYKGIHYTHLVGLPDYLEYELKKPIIGYHPEFKNPEFSEIDWNTAKSNYCLENNINLHFDDTLEYGKYFRTPFCRLWTKNK